MVSPFDSHIPHSARVWNYWLGGLDNFAADRLLGDQILEVMPTLVEAARADRAFLARVVRYLVSEARVVQFIDLGTGLPTANNTHEVAQRLAPHARIVYVDNDPIVLVHARALLTSDPLGATAYIDADVHDPDLILEQAASTLDFSRPVGLMMLGILNFVIDIDRARAIVTRFLDAVPSGSYLVVAHPTAEIHGEAMVEAVRRANETSPTKMTLRTPGEISSFFDGLELLEPGVVTCSRWRPTTGAKPPPAVSQFCGVGRKP